MILCDPKLRGAQQDAPRHFVSRGHVRLVIYLVSFAYSTGSKYHNPVIVYYRKIDRLHTDVDLYIVSMHTHMERAQQGLA